MFFFLSTLSSLWFIHLSIHAYIIPHIPILRSGKEKCTKQSSLGANHRFDMLCNIKCSSAHLQFEPVCSFSSDLLHQTRCWWARLPSCHSPVIFSHLLVCCFRFFFPHTHSHILCKDHQISRAHRCLTTRTSAPKTMNSPERRERQHKLLIYTCSVFLIFCALRLPRDQICQQDM